MKHRLQFSARKMFTVVGILCALFAIAHYFGGAWAYIFKPVPFLYLLIALVLSFQPTARLLAAASASIGVLGSIVLWRTLDGAPLNYFSWGDSVRTQVVLLVGGIPVLVAIALIIDVSRRSQEEGRSPQAEQPSQHQDEP